MLSSVRNKPANSPVTRETLSEVTTITTEILIPASPLMQFVYEHGHQADSYLATAPERKTFWSAGHGGLVSYVRVGSYVLVSGGLIAPPSERPRLLREFVQFTASRRWRANFFCIPACDIQLFHDVGFRVNKLGEDTAIDLGNVTFAGKSYEWVRRQTNYCLRHGVTFSEIRPHELSERSWADIQRELEDVGRDAMREKAQTVELKFIDGSLGAHELGHRRLFIAQTQHDGHTRIEGYVVCNPMRGGRAWSTEIYRHRVDAVRGTIAFLFHEIILQLQREGAEQVSLCFSPARNCEEPIPGDKPFVRKALVCFRNRCSLLFDMKGLDHFKSRFRPRYENTYLCSPPNPRFGVLIVGMGAILATIWALGLLRISPLKILKLAWARLWKRRTHTAAAD